MIDGEDANDDAIAFFMQPSETFPPPSACPCSVSWCSLYVLTKLNFDKPTLCPFFLYSYLCTRHVERWEAHDADRSEQRSCEIRPRDAGQVRSTGEDLGRGVRDADMN
jgi:hypothetical protein